MKESTSRINIPKLSIDQAYALDRVNSALQTLDILIDPIFLGLDVNVPPENPGFGDAYVVGDAPTSTWLGQEGKIAVFGAEGWTFKDPFDGLQAYVESDNTLRVFVDGGWRIVGSTDLLHDLVFLDFNVNDPPADPNTGDTYFVGVAPTGDWLDQAEKIAIFDGEAWTFYEPIEGLQAYVASDETSRVFFGDSWLIVGSTDLATRSGVETLSNKTFFGGQRVATNGSRFGITDAATPLSSPSALVQIVNNGSMTCGLRTTSFWEGSTQAPYRNNDNSLWETFNRVSSNSDNLSWSISSANAYNDIPIGVNDTGQRVGVLGWATSVHVPGEYLHAGTLSFQFGVRGRAGFQGTGSTGTVQNAIGVRGEIYNDSTDATIETARAGEFISNASAGTVRDNTAVFAAAINGTASNYSFFGQNGRLYNKDKVLVGSLATQSTSLVAARAAGNSVEFGHPSLAGFGSNIGATFSSGAPFVAFCAEVNASGNTFTTRGKIGTVIWNDLSGSMVFSRISNPNEVGQAPTEMARFDATGAFKLASNPSMSSNPPQSATAPGRVGEIAWDSDYFYVCVALNTWKRTALSTW